MRVRVTVRARVRVRADELLAPDQSHYDLLIYIYIWVTIYLIISSL